jgi:hypothetical protein
VGNGATVFSADKQALIAYALACSGMRQPVKVVALGSHSRINADCRLLKNGGYKIRINQNLKTVDFLLVLWHELCHAYQFSIGALRTTKKNFYWCGKRARMCYSKQPWEIEADKYAQTMANRFLNLTIG